MSGRDDDMDLWERVIRSVTPLNNRMTRAKGSSIKPKNPSEQGSSPIAYATPPPPDPVVQDKIRRIDGHMRRKMRRGTVHIDTQIDLHGMSKNRAYDALARFIPMAQVRGARCVLVITGKGHENKGLLRTLLPQWLADAPFTDWVLHATTAHIKHGGAGAWYVILRQR